MHLYSRLTVLSVVVTLFVFGGATIFAQEEKDRVESVDVQLNVAGSIYEGLQERIEFSIDRVGEKVLLGQSLTLLQAKQETVKSAIFNVFSKVLIGFKLDKVDLFIGSHTKVVIHLTPEPPLITKVRLNLDIQGLTPEAREFTVTMAKRMETELNQIFAGLPVAAVSWSEGIFDMVADYLMERELPGFTSRFTLIPGTTTEFNLVLTPLAPTVRTVQVDYAAQNIPVGFVKHQARKYEKNFSLLQGLPVEFLTHYQSRLESFIDEYCSHFSQLQQAGMDVKIGISPGETTRIRVMVDSRRYITRMAARYFTDGQGSLTNLQTYLGYQTDNYELFGSWYPLGENPSGKLSAGINFPVAPGTTAGFEYDFSYRYKNLNVRFQFERGDYLGLRLGIDHSTTEAVIGFYLADSLNLELVDLDNKLGIQVMLHF